MTGITYGMKSVGEPARLRPKPLLIFLGRALHSGWFWLGIPLMALSFYSLLLLLSWHPVSFVIRRRWSRSIPVSATWCRFRAQLRRGNAGGQIYSWGGSLCGALGRSNPGLCRCGLGRCWLALAQ
jgi:hypothetical protein